MTNFENIKNMSIEKMAENNIRPSCEPDIDYDYEENSFQVIKIGFATSDCEFFEYHEEALEHEINWLKAEKES